MPTDFSSFVTNDLPFAQPTLQLPYASQVPKQVTLYSSLTFCTCMATHQPLTSRTVFQSTASRIRLPVLIPGMGKFLILPCLHLFQLQNGVTNRGAASIRWEAWPKVSTQYMLAITQQTLMSWLPSRWETFSIHLLTPSSVPPTPPGRKTIWIYSVLQVKWATRFLFTSLISLMTKNTRVAFNNKHLLALFNSPGSAICLQSGRKFDINIISEFYR